MILGCLIPSVLFVASFAFFPVGPFVMFFVLWLVYLPFVEWLTSRGGR